MDDVRTEYKQLTDDEKARMASVKAAGQQFIDVIKASPAGRENSLAITNAEQAVMWAVKGITG